MRHQAQITICVGSSRFPSRCLHDKWHRALKVLAFAFVLFEAVNMPLIASAASGVPGSFTGCCPFSYEAPSPAQGDPLPDLVRLHPFNHEFRRIGSRSIPLSGRTARLRFPWTWNGRSSSPPGEVLSFYGVFVSAQPWLCHSGA